MAEIADAIAHLDAAIKELVLEAYRSADGVSFSPVDHFTIAEELKRVDCAIGLSGQSMFARLADHIVAAYVEIVAAKAALEKGAA